MQTIKAMVVGDGGAGKTSLVMSAFGEDTQMLEYLPVWCGISTLYTSGTP